MESFETTRLLIRPLSIEDEMFYCNCYTDKLLMRHVGTPLTHQIALRSFKAVLKMNSSAPFNRWTWVMQDKQKKHYIGLLSLMSDLKKLERDSAEIGAIIFVGFQNQGFAAEAISELVNIAFMHPSLAELNTNNSKANRAANRLMEKLGFMSRIDDTGHGTSWTLNRHDYLRKNLGLNKHSSTCN